MEDMIIVCLDFTANGYDYIYVCPDLDILFDGERLCKFCGINIDIPWLDILEFIHGDCWKEYRRKGLLYPMPKYVG
jgi:hypothetical protein